MTKRELIEAIEEMREEQKPYIEAKYDEIYSIAERMIEIVREEIYSEVAKQIDPEIYSDIFEKRLTEALKKRRSEVELPVILDIDQDYKIKHIIVDYVDEEECWQAYTVPNKDEHKYRDSTINKKIKDALDLLFSYYVISEEAYNEYMQVRTKSISQAEVNKRCRKIYRSKLADLDFSQRNIKELFNLLDNFKSDLYTFAEPPSWKK